MMTCHQLYSLVFKVESSCHMLEALNLHLTDAEAKFVLKPSANLVNEGVNEREDVGGSWHRILGANGQQWFKLSWSWGQNLQLGQSLWPTVNCIKNNVLDSTDSEPFVLAQTSFATIWIRFKHGSILHNQWLHIAHMQKKKSNNHNIYISK